MYRYQRVHELLDYFNSLIVSDAAIILRDQKGLKNADIGTANEKAVNQLIAHHSIIFKPKQRLVWVSTSPYQLGEYICYDLNEILANPRITTQQKEIYKKALTLPPDPFLESPEWQKFLEFRKQSGIIAGKSSKDERLTEAELNEFISLNPEYYYTYEICGDYLMKTGQVETAKVYFGKALKKEIPTEDERDRLNKKIAKCNLK
jgi:tetratricopeptide (TPR) repeat protein